jgi:hypothetical protein
MNPNFPDRLLYRTVVTSFVRHETSEELLRGEEQHHQVSRLTSGNAPFEAFVQNDGHEDPAARAVVAVRNTKNQFAFAVLMNAWIIVGSGLMKGLREGSLRLFLGTFVNGGAKMHRRAGAIAHQAAPSEGRTEGVATFNDQAWSISPG